MADREEEALKKVAKKLKGRQKRELLEQEISVKKAAEKWRHGPGLLVWLLIAAVVTVIYYLYTNGFLDRWLPG